MPLTLPGVLGRFFQNVTDLFQSSTLSGDTFPSRDDFGDARIYLGDGTEDLTSVTLNYVGPGSVNMLPKMYLKARTGTPALTLRGESGANIINIFEIEDHAKAPIFAVSNVGGVFLNDNFRQVIGAFSPYNSIFSDIYGHLQLGGNSAIRCTPGPPGNNMTFADSIGEIFQRTRGNTQGTWTATNATYAGFSMTGGTSPAGLTWARQWTCTTGPTNMVMSSAGRFPCVAGQLAAAMILTKAAATPRSKQLALTFWGPTGTQVGSAIPGTAVTDSTSVWTRLDVQTVTPAGAVSCDLQLTITTPATSEVHYDTCAGIWDGLTTANVTAWNAPYSFRQNAFLPGTVAASAVTGNGVSPIVVTVPLGHPFRVGDSVTTTGFTPNTNANQVNAVISATTTTSFTIPGTGNGATSTGSCQMTNSANGYYDGANAGDIAIRSDGPSNVVQRFWTNAAAGVPAIQNFVSDPRLTSQPARINWYGGTYLTQGATNSPDYVLPNVVLGMLHNDPPDSVNRGVAVKTNVLQLNLLADTVQEGTNSAQPDGGMECFIQDVRKKIPVGTACAPYVSKDGMFSLFYGLWDLAAVTSGGGAGMMSQFNGYSSSAGGATSAIVNTMRALICHARASVIVPYTNASFFSFSGGVSSGAGNFPYAYSNGSPGAAGQFYSYSAAGSFTFTIPADFTGGAVSIAMIGAPGSFGGTVTWTGTLFSTGGIANPGPTVISNTSPAGTRSRVVIRFKNLTAANASQTIIGTAGSFDASGTVNLDCAYIEGVYPNMVAICGSPKLLNNAAYATAGGTGSYWSNTSGTTGDTDVATLNASLLSLTGEFDSACFFVNMDDGMQKQAQLFASDGVRIDELGVHAMASQFANALNAQLPLINFRNVNHDYHDTAVQIVGSPFSKQGVLSVTTGVSRLYADDYYQLSSVRASVNTAPQGATVIVDVLKNGTTIFTTTANRPAIAAAGFTATSAAPPDLVFFAPGDYLTVNIAQVGTVFPGADMTVNVLGRKVPIP